MQTIPLPEKPKIMEASEARGIFEIEGCYPGFGVTLGNAVRRVLLSSLEGAAATNIKIKDVSHEFSTIPNVMEDVVQVILNVKRVRFIMQGDNAIKAKLAIKGEKTVKAGDIKAPSNLTVVNRDQIIATLTDKKAELEMEFTVEKGIGYQMAEERERKEKEIGVIEIDSLFSPITRVNLEVENMRVGKRTDFEKLRLTIETDGTISPENAFKQVAAILVKQFSCLTTPQMIKEVEKGKLVTGVSSAKEKDEVEGKAKKGGGTLEEGEIQEELGKNIPEGELLEMPIQKLKMPSRTANLLVEQNFKKIGDLAILSEEEILQIEGMGDKGLRDVKKALGNFGLILENQEEKELKELKKSK
ncbi:MAG: DNA-directed RNA polymerase subunit alpha [Candidatus Moranbacteria bacterium]|nr:DNA-directed RNA polymerase subunit alpha [Candidatus Moranbacteria bacterium]